MGPKKTFIREPRNPYSLNSCRKYAAIGVWVARGHRARRHYRWKYFLQPAKSLPDKIKIGWHFRRNSQGQGFATEAAKALLRFGFDTQGLEEVIAPIAPENQASRRVAEKLGMQPKLQLQ